QSVTRGADHPERLVGLFAGQDRRLKPRSGEPVDQRLRVSDGAVELQDDPPDALERAIADVVEDVELAALAIDLEHVAAVREDIVDRHGGDVDTPPERQAALDLLADDGVA